jgi:DhnA family fructose-bisphosphate aldolase class Ia
MATTGETIRLARFFSEGKRAVVVAIDHGLYFGPLPGMINLPATVKALSGADAVLMSPGAAAHCKSVFEKRGAPAMILRLNWASNYVANWKYSHSFSVPLLSVAEAVQQGADCVLASLTMKNPEEAEDAQNVELLSQFVNEKRELGMPLIGEVFPTGGDDARPEDLFELVYMGCRIAAELGVDMVKTFYTGSRFEEIVAATPVPILALGAKKMEFEKDALELAATATRAGLRPKCDPGKGSGALPGCAEGSGERRKSARCSGQKVWINVSVGFFIKDQTFRFNLD